MLKRGCELLNVNPTQSALSTHVRTHELRHTAGTLSTAFIIRVPWYTRAQKGGLIHKKPWDQLQLAF